LLRRSKGGAALPGSSADYGSSLPTTEKWRKVVKFAASGQSDLRLLIIHWEGLMRFPRRQFLRLAAGAAAVPILPRIARAQTYPIRPIHLIVPYPPGGGTDIIARLMGQWLSERLGQQFIIENRPGGNSNIATEAVVRAPTDGYTLLVVDSAPAIALAVTTASRSEALPDIPSLSEFLPGYEATDWKGMVAPKNTPPEIIDKLNKEINAGLADPKLRARFAELISPVMPGSPADFGQFIAEETQKWAKVVKFAGIKAD
jgi:tripartite-type tricarboxylate transporter receptor subunit TctC